MALSSLCAASVALALNYRMKRRRIVAMSELASLGLVRIDPNIPDLALDRHADATCPGLHWSRF